MSKRNRYKREQRGQGGFTMVELLVTLAITTIGLAGLMALNVSTGHGNAAAGYAADAVIAAQDTMESLRSMSYGNMLTELTAPGTTLPENNPVAIPLPIDVTMPTVAGRAGMTYRRRVVVKELTQASANLALVHVEISYTDDGAVTGSDNGLHDHTLTVELIRSELETM